jgi:predicted transcriptional regulator
VGQFGALEAAIMDVVWAREASMSGREVLEALHRDRPLAYTTVMTVLDNLYRKGWVRRELDGRAWRYSAVMSRDAYTAEMMSQLVSASPDPQSVFLHLVSQLSPEETAQLRAALRRAPKASS